jgi:hypothetical protein
MESFTVEAGNRARLKELLREPKRGPDTGRKEQGLAE